MAEIELCGTKTCPHTQDARESLEWKGREFTEHDVVPLNPSH
jgi:glutaredoxin